MCALSARDFTLAPSSGTRRGMCGPRASRAHLQGPRTQVVKESSSGAGVRGSATLPSPASGSRRPAAVGVRSLGTARPRGLGPRSGAGPPPALPHELGT